MNSFWRVRKTLMSMALSYKKYSYKRMDIPESYLAGLTPQQRLVQAKLIQRSRQQYQKSGLVQDRPSVSKEKVPRSSHAKEFERRFNFKVTELDKVKKLFPDTDVETILKKGYGAYMSAGSRPNVSSHQWAMGRLASVLTGGAALSVDKNLVGPKSLQIIKS